MRLGFTYVDDIVAGVVAALDHAPSDHGAPKASVYVTPHRLQNIGNNRVEALIDMIAAIESACGRQADLNFLPMSDGDVILPSPISTPSARLGLGAIDSDRRRDSEFRRIV